MYDAGNGNNLFLRGHFKTAPARAFWLGLISAVAAVPYFYYLAAKVMPLSGAVYGKSAWFLILPQVMLLFLLCFLCSLGGYLFFRRQKLPGFGSLSRLAKDIPILAACGLVLTGASYFLFDRYFFTLSPVSYPENFFYIMAVVIKAAFTEEIILRWGITTLAIALVKNRKWGVILASGAASLLTFKYFKFIQIEINWSYIFIVRFGLTFLFNLILGYLFVTRGLFHSMGLKFFMGARYIAALALLH